MKNKLMVMGTALSAVLVSAVSSVDAATIFADEADGQLELRSEWNPQDPVVQDTTGWSLGVGEWWGSGLLTTVIPFELPNLGAVADPFTAVDFGVRVDRIGDATVTDLDLYAVRTDASPTILASDWYNGADPDPSATLLQTSFLTPSSTQGDITPGVKEPNNFTDAAGDAALLSYMNSAYAGGAGAGDFVFLRLSYGSDDYATGWDAYTMNSRNEDVEGKFPRITYEAIPEPATLGLLGLSGLVLWIRRKMS